MGGSALSDHLIQVQDSANRLNGLSNGWARPFNKADRLLEEKTTVFKGTQNSEPWQPTT